MLPLVLVILVLLLIAMFNFPGGPTGFATYTFYYIKRKLARHFDEPVSKAVGINRYDGSRKASWTFRPR